MKVKKLLLKIVGLALIMCLFIATGMSYAATTTRDTLYAGMTVLKKNSTPGWGYAIGSKSIWNLVSYTDTDRSGYIADDILYCVRAGYGFGTTRETAGSTDESNVRDYNKSYNLKLAADVSEIKKLSTRTQEYSNIVDNGYYNSIMWIFDNMYIPTSNKATDERAALLEKAAKAATGNDELEYNKLGEEELAAFPITDEEIEVTQQMAIWYFTEYENVTGYTNSDDYHKTAEEFYNGLKITTDGTSYTTLSTYHQNTDGQGPIEAAQMQMLYNYLITTAESMNETYDTTANTATEVTYWVNETSNVEQPLVEVTRDTPEEQEQEFDLALRKQIVKVQDNEGNETAIINEAGNSAVRSMNIDADTIPETATYKHRKDPVVVELNNIVTYKLTIYNEGTIDGYASKIVDQLPTGLESTLTTGDKVTSTKGNEYTVTYNETDNKLEFTINKTSAESITAYDGATLSSDSIDVTCKVTQTPSTDGATKHYLTNIAYIAEEYDKDGNEITQDRDGNESKPTSSPTNTANSLNNTEPNEYKGNTANPSIYDDTTNSYYYEGQEDDDDFETVVVDPKKFDLSLKKFIAAISSDANIEEGEYITDTGNSDGVYTRAPKVKSIQSRVIGEDGTQTQDTVSYELNDKEALLVKNGDYVLYTFRIYNEGEIDGYASLIRDSIPDGLEFVTTDVTYNGIWTLSKDLESITTDYLAKGNGAEIDSEEGDANYTANLLKALKTNEDGTGTVSTTDPLNPDYKDVQVLFKVTEPNSSKRILTNQAQIAEDTDSNGNEVKDIDSTPDEWIDGEDDQDIERVKLQNFDLALRKFITSVDGNATTGREPQEKIDELVNGTDTTATYEHEKQPLAVQKGSTIVYTIRVYNEGDINGYASEVVDHLPEYLEFVKDSEINTKYKWNVSEDGRTVTTNYLADYMIDAFNGTTLDHEDIQIECKVKDTAKVHENITNIAEITEYRDEEKQEVNPDIDSTSNSLTDENTGNDNLPTDEDLPTYKDEEINSGDKYIPGQEDDDDFEKVYIQNFDLALRKFITNISGTDVTTRIPVVTYEDGTITYTHPKDAMNVVVGDTVTYTIRVYNEGEIAGYASEIADDIPEYLTYLPENETNTKYGWVMYDKDGNETSNVEDAVEIRTTYLSKDKETTEGQYLLNAFDAEKEISDTNPAYLDVQVAFKVKDPNSNTTIITNYAQITKDTDENGKEVDDIDSIPDEWNEGEDDQDIENVKVQYFDLALLKYVTKVMVTEDGKQTITKTGNVGDENDIIPKVEIHRKKINSTTVKFAYTIKITNEGDIAGYAKEITDDVPEGLKFVADDNPSWTENEDGTISTKALENTLLQPGESATVEVIFTWINGSDNLGLKTNTAEISEDYNEKGVPDRDSTPGNNKAGEDDIDTAEVLLSISTGMAKTYIVLAGAVLIILASGIIIIRKFVL